MGRKIDKLQEIQNQINLLQLELNQEKDQEKRNKLLQRLEIKIQEKDLQKMKDLM